MIDRLRSILLLEPDTDITLRLALAFIIQCLPLLPEQQTLRTSITEKN